MSTDPDAAALFGTLKTLLETPTLLSAAKDSFDTTRAVLEESSLDELIRLEVVHARHDLETACEQYFQKRATAQAAEQDLADVERQLKTIDVRLKRAESDAQRSRILKSKTERWEDDNRRGKFKKEREALVARRHKLRGDCADAKRDWTDLIATIDASVANQQARWTDPFIIGLTDTSYFLFEELNEMNPDNFFGRRISEVLRIGPLLG
ncbi:MAG: hypothetical protein VX589_04025 [Myxococcota bacterium]|nr:hypothetical protein [Myxococcota bacterium]